jgi:hypothetical protein
MMNGISASGRDLKRALPAQVSFPSVLSYEMENLIVILIFLFFYESALANEFESYY